ncbi:hypothetical protein [Chryseobacterium indologenes]|uniref:hypothetical protein n=1 Tax=Chryseobacterium indologenes TaxID=253 RepID=UPI00405917CF
MIKHTITNRDQNPETETKEKAFDHSGFDQAETFEQINFYRWAYSYPYVPMVDLTLIFDELGKMMADRLFKRRENRNTYKNKIHETL